MVQRSIRRTVAPTTAVAPVAKESTTTVARRRARPVSEASEDLPVPAAPVTSFRRRIAPVAAPVAVAEQVAEPATAGSSRTDYDRIIATYKEKATTPKNAIRAACVTCMGGMIAEVARCTSEGCPLYPFRMGKNPYHKLSKNNQESSNE